MDTVEDAIEAKEELFPTEINELEGLEATENFLQVQMSNLFGKITRTFGWEVPPTKVLHAQLNEYDASNFLYKDDIFIATPLIEPCNAGSIKYSFEVLVYKEFNGTTQCYSVLRTITDEEVMKFAKDCGKIFPCLINSCGKEFLNQSSLQKVLDTYRENLQWNAAHYVAYFGFVEALKNEDVLRLLHCFEESENGFYPIHLAVENESEKMIIHLLNAGATINVYDRKGNSPIHLAASKNLSIIQNLKIRRADALNRKNKREETPLIIAAKASKMENIKYLIQNGANINHSPTLPAIFDTMSYNDNLKLLETSRDISHKDLDKGGSLLHWVKSKEMVNVAIDLGCDPNLPNSQLETPLHIMVIRSRLQCLMVLLSRGANPNCQNNQGDSPLHIAASTNSVNICQALISFGAKINILNKSAETPRHLASNTKLPEKGKCVYTLHSVGAQRCEMKSASCGEGCSINGSFNGVPLYEKPLKRSRWVFDDHIAKCQMLEAVKHSASVKGRKGRVLCLDGGGIKGLVLCQLLDVIKQKTGQSITDSFDWIAGTSTGGFLALDIAKGKSVNHAQDLYYSLKDRIFSGTRPYDTSELEKILKEEFGNNTTMDSIVGKRVNITTALADRLPADLHLFRNYQSPIDVLKIGESNEFERLPSCSSQKIWQAAKASGAAPTYFNSNDKYLDGGLIANNPVLDVLTEIEEWNMAVRAVNRPEEVFTPTVIVSLGCGKCPVVKVDTVDLTLPSLLEFRRGFTAMYNMFNILVEQACSSEGRVVDRARAWCSALKLPLFRFNPELSEDCSLDESDDNKLVKIMWEARAYMETQQQFLEELKPLLMNDDSSSEQPAPPLRSTKNSSQNIMLNSPTVPLPQEDAIEACLIPVPPETRTLTQETRKEISLESEVRYQRRSDSIHIQNSSSRSEDNLEDFVLNSTSL